MTCRFLCILLLCVAPLAAGADDRLVRLSVPEALVETGLFQHILPRFSLKTQVRVTLVAPQDMPDLQLGDVGRPVFDGLDRTWRAQILSEGHRGTERFVTWLRSDVGQRTVTGFSPDGQALFSPPTVQQAETVEVVDSELVRFGRAVSVQKCTRCHAVDDATRGAGHASTPGFSILRTLRDWDSRFAAFYVLNPHPSFMIITDVTAPLSQEHPSSIAPIEMTIEEVEAVLAYVAAMAPADLGQPIQHQ